MSYPPLYTARMKNIINDLKHPATSPSPTQTRLSLTPCFSKVPRAWSDSSQWQPMPKAHPAQHQAL
jgi:hypothetical protein